jgi:hypothetical protein
MELIERAKSYAVQKTDELITKAIEQAYIDGYRDGYKDRENEIPVVLTDGNVEYVDLGLPSKTLWSTDYVKEKGEIVYLPYCEANKYNIPTKKQWEELRDSCRWRYDSKEKRFIGRGPNGRDVFFSGTGYIEFVDKEKLQMSFLWIQETLPETIKRNAISFAYNTNTKKVGSYICYEHVGYALPIRLVR